MENLLLFFESLGNIIYGLFAWVFSAESSGVLTLSTGLIAWYVFKSQNNSREKEAAIVLRNEIRNAERALTQIRDSGFDVQNETILILPKINSWGVNYKIFAGMLRQHEFEIINDFFLNCLAAQQELDQWRKYFIISRENKAGAIQSKLIDIANLEQEEYQKERDEIIKKANKEDFLFDFNKPKEYFSKYINSINIISGTTAMNTIDDMINKK